MRVEDEVIGECDLGRAIGGYACREAMKDSLVGASNYLDGLGSRVRSFALARLTMR